MAYVANTSFAPVSLVATVKNVLESVKTQFAKRDLFYSTYNELNRLSDRELADIGVARSNIEQMARDHAYGA